MATRTLYRSLMIEAGKIELKDYDFYQGQIVLDEVHVQYDDTIQESHRRKLIAAIEDNIEKKKADHFVEIKKLEDFREQLLTLEHKPDGN